MTDSTTTTSSSLAENFAAKTTITTMQEAGGSHSGVGGGETTGTGTTTTLMKPHPMSIPRTVTRNNILIAGIATNTTVQIYENRIVMLVSQLPSSKVGTFLMCEYRQCQINPKMAEYPVTNLLGTAGGGGGHRQDDDDEALLDIYARNILEGIVNIHKKNQQSQQQQQQQIHQFPTVLVLGISLLKKKKKKMENGQQQQQQHDPEAFKNLVHFLVHELYRDAIL